MNAGGVKNRGLNDRNQVITTSLANKLTQVEKGNTSAGAEATYPSSSGDGSKQNADSDHSQRDARGDDLAAREETLAKRERALYTRQEALNNAPSNTGPECAGTALVKNAIRGNTEAKTAATVDSVPPTAAATTDNETTVPTAPSLPPSSDIDNVPPPPPLKVVATVTGAPLAGRGSLLAGVGQVTLRRPKEDRQDTVLPDGKKNASPATFIGSIAGGYAAMELRKRNVNQGLGTAAPTSDTGLPPGPAKGARAGVAAKGDMPDWPKSAIAAGKAVAAAKKVVTATTTSTVEGSNPTQRAKPTAADVRDEGSNNKGTGNDTVTTVNRQAELKAQIAKTKKALAEKKAAEEKKQAAVNVAPVDADQGEKDAAKNQAASSSNIRNAPSDNKMATESKEAKEAANAYVKKLIADGKAAKAKKEAEKADKEAEENANKVAEIATLDAAEDTAVSDAGKDNVTTVLTVAAPEATVAEFAGLQTTTVGADSTETTVSDTHKEEHYDIDRTDAEAGAAAHGVVLRKTEKSKKESQSERVARLKQENENGRQLTQKEAEEVRAFDLRSVIDPEDQKDSERQRNSALQGGRTGNVTTTLSPEEVAQRHAANERRKKDEIARTQTLAQMTAARAKEKSTSDLKTALVAGMAGLKKTTLAQKNVDPKANTENAAAENGLEQTQPTLDEKPDGLNKHDQQPETENVDPKNPVAAALLSVLNRMGMNLGDAANDYDPNDGWDD